MAISVQEKQSTGVRLPYQAKRAVKAYADLVWQIPEAKTVYAYLEDEWLVVVAVGAYFQHDDRYRIYAFQREIEQAHSEFHWGFQLRDQKDIPHQIPNPGADEVYILSRPRKR